jgi:hydrogenase maturation protease
MAPVAVLASLESLGGRLPSTYVVGCRPCDTGEGIGLSGPVEAAVPRAMDTVHALLRDRIVTFAGAAEGDR